MSARFKFPRAGEAKPGARLQADLYNSVVSAIETALIGVEANRTNAAQLVGIFVGLIHQVSVEHGADTRSIFSDKMRETLDATPAMPTDDAQPPAAPESTAK